MIYVPVQCPYCHSTEVIKAASKPTGRNAIAVTTTGARGGSCSCSIRIAADLNLTDAQKAQLKTALETAREKNPTSREPMYSRSSWPSVALRASGGTVLHPGTVGEVGCGSGQGQDGFGPSRE